MTLKATSFNVQKDFVETTVADPLPYYSNHSKTSNEPANLVFLVDGWAADLDERVGGQLLGRLVQNWNSRRLADSRNDNSRGLMGGRNMAGDLVRFESTALGIRLQTMAHFQGRLELPLKTGETPESVALALGNCLPLQAKAATIVLHVVKVTSPPEISLWYQKKNMPAGMTQPDVNGFWLRDNDGLPLMDARFGLPSVGQRLLEHGSQFSFRPLDGVVRPPQTSAVDLADYAPAAFKSAWP